MARRSVTHTIGLWLSACCCPHGFPNTQAWHPKVGPACATRPHSGSTSVRAGQADNRTTGGVPLVKSASRVHLSYELLRDWNSSVAIIAQDSCTGNSCTGSSCQRPAIPSGHHSQHCCFSLRGRPLPSLSFRLRRGSSLPRHLPRHFDQLDINPLVQANALPELPYLVFEIARGMREIVRAQERNGRFGSALAGISRRMSNP